MYRLILLLALMLPSMAASNPLESIYRIVASNCVGGSSQRISTGFSLNNNPGIVTALHAVAGCSSIFAVQAQDPAKSFTGLEIDLVDFSRDLAILNSNSLPAGNLTAASSVQPAQKLFVIGFPAGVSGFHRMEVIVNRPAKTQIRRRIPPSVAQDFSARNSPAISTEVIDILGDLQVGQSGAPVFAVDGSVIGVVNGGIGNGQYGIGWAIPIVDAQFSPVSTVRNRLQELIRLDHYTLFATSVDASNRSLGRRERNALVFIGLAEFLRKPIVSCNIGSEVIDFDPGVFINGLRTTLDDVSSRVKPLLNDSLYNEFTNIVDLSVPNDAELSRLLDLLEDNQRQTSVKAGFGMGRQFIDVLFYFGVAKAERAGLTNNISIFEQLEVGALKECLKESTEVNQGVLASQALRMGLGQVSNRLPNIERAASSETALKQELDKLFEVFLVRSSN